MIDWKARRAMMDSGEIVRWTTGYATARYTAAKPGTEKLIRSWPSDPATTCGHAHLDFDPALRCRERLLGQRL